MDDEKLNELVTKLGRKIIDIQSDVKVPFRKDIELPEVSSKVHAKERQSSILRLVRNCDEYKELLDALNESSRITKNRLDEILTEFTMETAYGPCSSRSWDSKFVEKELSLMTKAFIQGLTTPSADTGIVFPLLNIEMDTYSIDLGEFGVIRRSTFSETTEFAIHYPNFTMPYARQRFKYVLDCGKPDSTEMYPVPAKYMKILERTIFALRLVFGDGVGVEFAHWWIKEEDTFVSTIPMSKYLAPRGDPTKIWSSNVWSSDVKQLIPILHSIHNLDEESFYLQSLRRYGAALYTLDSFLTRLTSLGPSLVPCYQLLGESTMSFLLMQSPLQNFSNLILTYFIEIWDFLLFIGQVSGIIIVLIGAILWFTETNQSRGKGLVFGGVMLSIVIEYFVLFPPAFVII